MTHIVMVVLLVIAAAVVLIIDLRRRKANVQPLQAAAPQRPAEQDLAPEGPREAVLVDDSPALRASIRQVLERQGYRVFEAADGREMTARLRQLTTPGATTVIIVDSDLPETDGVELVRSLRADPAYDRVRLVLMAPGADADRVAAAFDEGAVRHLPKPFTSESLLATLRSATE